MPSQIKACSSVKSFSFSSGRIIVFIPNRFAFNKTRSHISYYTSSKNGQKNNQLDASSLQQLIARVVPWREDLRILNVRWQQKSLGPWNRRSCPRPCWGRPQWTGYSLPSTSTQGVWQCLVGSTHTAGPKWTRACQQSRGARSRSRPLLAGVFWQVWRPRIFFVTQKKKIYLFKNIYYGRVVRGKPENKAHNYLPSRTKWKVKETQKTNQEAQGAKRRATARGHGSVKSVLQVLKELTL